jgi:DNA-binding NarL/FixJ family response regulator
VIRVVVADDHAVVRRGLQQILGETDDILVIGEASTAVEVRHIVQVTPCDVVVLDVTLPGGNGIELIGDVRRARPQTPVLILTAHSEDQYAVRALRAGAAGFLTKESAPEHLVEALRKLAAGGRYISAAVADQLAAYVASEGVARPHDALSDRELQILKLIASGRTVSQVAEELSLSVKTVSTHRTRLLKKMNMKTNAELTSYAVRAQLVE